MFRFIAGCVVAAMVTTGVVPCALSGAASAMTQHDCCDPDQPDALGTTDLAAPTMTTGLADCCLASADTRVPPASPALPSGADVRISAAVTVAPLPFIAPAPARGISNRDLRSRSAPRPPVVTVLLI